MLNKTSTFPKWCESKARSLKYN